MTTRQGSGVVIGDLEGQPVVATCLHNLGDRQKCSASVTVGQATYPARVIGYSDALDVALLAVRMPLQASLDPIVIDEQAEQTAAVEMVGFPEGRFTRVRSRVVSRDAKWNLITDRPTQQGQSGGALFSERGLAGVVKWTDSRSSYATPGFQVAAMARHYRVKLKVKARGVIAPLPPAPAPPVAGPPAEKNPWFPDSDTPRKLDEMSERIKAIEETLKKLPAGPAGPAGKEGAAGLPGPAGPVGPAGTVTVILIGPDGKEIKRAEQVQTGSVVRLDISKVLIEDVNDGRGK